MISDNNKYLFSLTEGIQANFKQGSFSALGPIFKVQGCQSYVFRLQFS